MPPILEVSVRRCDPRIASSVSIALTPELSLLSVREQRPYLALNPGDELSLLLLYYGELFPLLVADLGSGVSGFSCLLCWIKVVLDIVPPSKRMIK